MLGEGEGKLGLGLRGGWCVAGGRAVLCTSGSFGRALRFTPGSAIDVVSATGAGIVGIGVGVCWQAIGDLMREKAKSSLAWPHRYQDTSTFFALSLSPGTSRRRGTRPDVRARWTAPGSARRADSI